MKNLEESNVSLVQAFIHHDFVLVCSDQKLTSSEGDEDNFKKVYKLNQNTIFGFTGQLIGNYQLFRDFSGYYLIPERNQNLSFNDVVNKVKKRFSLLSSMNDIQKKNANFKSIICGWDGKHMHGYCFSLLECNGFAGVREKIATDNSEIFFFNCGNAIHNDAMHATLDNMDVINIPNILKAFQNILDTGIQFDHTINNRLHYEMITRRDIHNNLHT